MTSDRTNPTGTGTHRSTGTGTEDQYRDPQPADQIGPATWTVPGTDVRSQDPVPSPGTVRYRPDSRSRYRQDRDRGTGTDQDRPVPPGTGTGGTEGDASTGTSGTGQDPESWIRRVTDHESRKRRETGNYARSRALIAQGVDPDDLPDPWWLANGIVIGIWILSLISIVLASDGQIAAAENSGVTGWQKYAAPAVLELLAVTLQMVGYLQGRHKKSPVIFWLLAAVVGGYAVYLVIDHAPTPGHAAIYAGASIGAQLLTFIKLQTSLTRYQAKVLGIRRSSRIKFGELWLIKPAIAFRGRMLAGEFGEIQTYTAAVTAAKLWRSTRMDTLEDLLDAAPAKLGLVKARRYRRRARLDARRTADNIVAVHVGAPTARVPRTVEIARSRVIPTSPSTASTGTGQSGPAGTGPVSPGPAGTAPVPPVPVPDPAPISTVQDPIQDSVPVPSVPVPTSLPVPSVPVPVPVPSSPDVPVPPIAPEDLAAALDTIRTITGAVPAGTELRKHAEYYERDLAKLLVVYPACLTGGLAPTKEGCRTTLQRGSVHAAKIRQTVERLANLNQPV